jgi:DNA adenine methylase
VKVTRPPLRYFGGKWMLAPWIVEHFPPHRIYIEAFGGGASVLLRKPRVYAEVYNDLDKDVVSFFRVLRDDALAARLIEQLHLTPFSREELLAARAPCEDAVEAARRLVVRSFLGHGPDSYKMDSKTGFRGNVHAAGRTPQGDWRNYPESLVAVVDRLRGVKIENQPATSIMRKVVEADCLTYLDPPYEWSTRTKLRGPDAKPGGGYAHEMTGADHVEFLEVAASMAGMVIISGYPTALYDEALAGWRRVEREARADGQSLRTEVLWINPAAAAALDAARGRHDQPGLFVGAA